MIHSYAYALLACPQCTFDRVMPTWVWFAFLRLGVVLLVVHGRMDPVRTLGVFVGFEVVYHYAWREAVWYSHPAVADGIVALMAEILLIVLSAGIPAALLLSMLAKIPYFRGAQTNQLTWKRALLLIPILFVLAVIQMQMTNRIKPHVFD